MPQRSAQSTVDLTAGAGSRYVAQYASVMGTDMTQLEASGYKLVQGRMPMRAGEVLLGKYAAYQFMDKYRSDDDSRRIAPGDYECDENGCKESEGEKPFFDVLTTKLNLITGADYQSPDDYRKIGSTSMSSTDSATAMVLPVRRILWFPCLSPWSVCWTLQPIITMHSAPV